MRYPPKHWSDQQYEQYLELRSRLHSIVENPKRVGRQLRRLDQAMYRADPEARALAIGEPAFKMTYDTLVRTMPRLEWRHRHHPRSFKRIQELIQTIFVEPTSNYPTPV